MLRQEVISFSIMKTSFICNISFDFLLPAFSDIYRVQQIIPIAFSEKWKCTEGCSNKMQIILIS